MTSFSFTGRDRNWTLTRVAALLLLVLGLLGATSVVAQDGQSSVRLDGRILFRLSASADATSDQRAARVEQRLQALLDTLEGPAEARIVSSGSTRLVTVSGVSVATVTAADAEDSITTLDQLAEEWRQAIEQELERSRQQRLGFGGRFLAEIRGAIGTAFSITSESSGAVVPRVLAAVLILTIFVLVARVVAWALKHAFRRFRADKTMENLIRQLAYYSIVLMGLLVAAGAMGFSPEAVVTGLGLTGLVLGFALKDILSNFVSGLLILAMRPFEIGDQIAIGDTEGAVERIELRATQIRTYDGRVALVPNAEVFTSRIVNNTADPVRRGNVLVTVGLGTDIRKISALLTERAQSAPGVLSDRAAVVRVEDANDERVVLNVSFWTDSRRSDFKDTSSQVRLAAIDVLIACGHLPPDTTLRRIELADPEAWRRLVAGTQEAAGRRLP